MKSIQIRSWSFGGPRRRRYAGHMLYLASKSPRRRQLLDQIGVRFSVLQVDIPELRGAGESPEAYVRRVARDKALAGLAEVKQDPQAHVLGSDTEVVLGDRVFGKPGDAVQAAEMLRQLCGREHHVISSVWLLDQAHAREATCISRVRIAELDDADIAAYIATGECYGKAGGYAIQGRAAAFIEHLEGSYSAVMGLPLFETAGLLRAAGLSRGH
jgi:septum formation protein